MNFRNMFQGRENEIEVGGRYTIKSHGRQLAGSHKHDWMILILLVAIEIILNIIHPFYRFVGKDMMTDLRYPMQENTVPVWSVPLYTVLLPIAVFVFYYLRRGDVHDLHHSILGLLFAVLITGVLTDAIKDAVGRPRPDFFWRCFPDGKDAYDMWGNVVCHGKDRDIKEGHKSFPSGHASWSFAGLSFLSLYLAGKIKCFDCKGHVAKLCLIFVPLLAACLVCISRVDDYWHHWQDVFAGGILGLVVATLCYLQFFPLPNHSQGWGPYAYFRALEEAQSTAQHGNGISMEGVQRTATHSSGGDHNLDSSFDAMESGRRKNIKSRDGGVRYEVRLEKMRLYKLYSGMGMGMDRRNSESRFDGGRRTSHVLLDFKINKILTP